jgi:hypothetical protein
MCRECSGYKAIEGKKPASICETASLPLPRLELARRNRLAAETGYRYQRLLECQSGACPRLADLEPTLGFRWVTDPRTSALLLQATISLRPGWRFVGILNPMGQGGLIAPLREPGHNAAMHA